MDRAALDEMVAMMDGELEIVDDIVDTWLVEAPNLVDAMTATADVEAIYHAAHTLKSSSLSIGALQLGALAADIESSARDGIVASARIERAREEFNAVSSAITAWRADRR